MLQWLIKNLSSNVLSFLLFFYFGGGGGGLQGTCYGAYVATAMCNFDSLYSDNNKDSSFEKIVSVMLSHIYTFQIQVMFCTFCKHQ